MLYIKLRLQVQKQCSGTYSRVRVTYPVIVLLMSLYLSDRLEIIYTQFGVHLWSFFLFNFLRLRLLFQWCDAIKSWPFCNWFKHACSLTDLADSFEWKLHWQTSTSVSIPFPAVYVSDCLSTIWYSSEQFFKTGDKRTCLLISLAYR